MPGLQYAGTVVVTTSGSYTAFVPSTTTLAVNATFVRLVNDGSGRAFVDFTSTSAGTTGYQYPLANAEALTITWAEGYVSGVSMQTSAGSTSASVRILAVA